LTFFGSCRECLAGHAALAPHVLPFLFEKLESSVINAKVSYSGVLTIRRVVSFSTWFFFFSRYLSFGIFALLLHFWLFSWISPIGVSFIRMHLFLSHFLIFHLFRCFSILYFLHFASSIC